MKSFLIAHAYSLIAGPLVGVLVYVAHEQLQKVIGWLERQGPLVKRAFAFVLSAVFMSAGSVFGVAVPGACTTRDVDLTACLASIGDKGWLGAVLGGGVALLIHRATHPPKPTA